MCRGGKNWQKKTLSSNEEESSSGSWEEDNDMECTSNTGEEIGEQEQGSGDCSSVMLSDTASDSESLGMYYF